ncbi:MAG: hypothetical protein IIU30_13195 [Treponema sp.]|nr:hypothetical protein [Treponema sp.]
MKSIKNALVRKSLLLCALFVFTGLVSCTPEVKTVYQMYDLEGTWSAQYEQYTINFDNGTFDSGAYSYAGNNMVIKFTDNDAGYIFVKYTRAYEFTAEDKSSDDTWTKTTWPSAGYYRYSSTAPDVGKWYAISFKNLTSNSISLSGAAGATEGHYLTSTDTLEEAIAEFTIDNGYFGWYSELVKSE